jgi:acyl-CoA reductase-like NAD-dependent aldehyde dehydrogenase
MSEADILVAEVMPLLAACRFLEQQAPRILRPRRPDGARPMWLAGTRLLVRRVPFGVVLILSPRNYPLLLPAVQAVQAVVAGNGVVVKPAPGCAEPMLYLNDALRRAGLPDGLFRTLPDTAAAGAAALGAGVDKVFLTGGSETGHQVLSQLAETVTPSVMELSGDDALVVLPGARLEVVARAIAYGLLLNGGETCIAPRRILAVGDTGLALVNRLAELLPTLPKCHVTLGEAHRLRSALGVAKGRLLGEVPGEGAETMRPTVLVASTLEACLPPLFGPAASLMVVPDVDAAVSIANAGRHALGASVFGPSFDAQSVAKRLRAGCIVVNDLIGPTADPRLPFAGTGASGFGVTRGAEGLLEMTRPQAITSRRWPLSSHYRTLPTSAAPWIARGLRLVYGHS